MGRTTSDRRSLYFITCDEFVKVGIAFDVAKRMDDLGLGDPYGKLKLATKWWLPALFARQIEKRVHESLADYSHGREWFRLSAKDAIAIARPVVQHGRLVHQHVVRLGFLSYED